MSEAAADLHMLNVIVSDMAASRDFYRRLGVSVPDDPNPADAHVQLRLPRGFGRELDTPESVRRWHAGWRADPASAGVVIGFALPGRQAVDQRYAEVTVAGYTGRRPFFDAFWGARYAVVADSDRHDVGLMSPIDEARRTCPRRNHPARNFEPGLVMPYCPPTLRRRPRPVRDERHGGFLRRADELEMRLSW